MVVAATAPMLEMLAKVVAVEMLGFEGRTGVRLADVEPWPDAAIEGRFAEEMLDVARDYRVLLDLEAMRGVTGALAVVLEERARALSSLDGARPGISSPGRLARLFAVAAADLRGDDPSEDASGR